MSIADEVVRMKKELQRKIHDTIKEYEGKVGTAEPLQLGEIIESLEMVKTFYLTEFVYHMYIAELHEKIKAVEEKHLT